MFRSHPLTHSLTHSLTYSPTHSCLCRSHQLRRAFLSESISEYVCQYTHHSCLTDSTPTTILFVRMSVHPPLLSYWQYTYDYLLRTYVSTPTTPVLLTVHPRLTTIFFGMSVCMSSIHTQALTHTLTLTHSLTHFHCDRNDWRQAQ